VYRERLPRETDHTHAETTALRGREGETYSCCPVLCLAARAYHDGVLAGQNESPQSNCFSYIVGGQLPIISKPFHYFEAIPHAQDVARVACPHEQTVEFIAAVLKSAAGHVPDTEINQKNERRRRGAKDIGAKFVGWFGGIPQSLSETPSDLTLSWHDKDDKNHAEESFAISQQKKGRRWVRTGGKWTEAKEEYLPSNRLGVTHFLPTDRDWISGALSTMLNANWINCHMIVVVEHESGATTARSCSAKFTLKVKTKGR
jgi:hypothetical protein